VSHLVEHLQIVQCSDESCFTFVHLQEKEGKVHSMYANRDADTAKVCLLVCWLLTPSALSGFNPHAGHTYQMSSIDFWFCVPRPILILNACLQ
jgi:hypothetical protein